MKMPKRCGNCGSTDLKRLSAEETASFPWKDYPAVNLKLSGDIVKCGSCGELLLNASQARGLDDKIVHTIVQQIQTFITMILHREKCEQKIIAAHLGVSPEYLSEIKSGRKIPKFQTFNFLKTMALDATSFKVSAPTYQSGKQAV